MQQSSNNLRIVLRGVGRGSVMTGFVVTWLMAWGGGSRPWVFGTAWNSQVWKKGKIGFNQPASRHNFFYSPHFISVAKKVFLGIKIFFCFFFWGGDINPSHPNYTYDGRYCRAWLFRDICLFVATNDDRRTRKSQVTSGHLHDTRGRGTLLLIVTVYETGVHHFDPESMLQ